MRAYYILLIPTVNLPDHDCLKGVKIMIKLLIMDIDGTLTDGKIYMGSTGEMFKAFDIKDGYAIHDILPAHGIIPIIITGRQSEIVDNRCEELNITEMYQGCINKADKIRELAFKYGIFPDDDGIYEECAYIGDDILDIPGMQISGVSACPADAVDEVKNTVTYLCKKRGGNGAVREFVEWIVKC